MTVRSGELTDLIVFEKKVRTQIGEIEYTSWVRDFQEWADAARLAEQITTFRIHYRRGITPDTHRILAFDSVWTITNVLPDARYAELKIECDWSAQIEVTHMKSPTREWITGLPAVAMPIPEDEDEEFMNPIISDITKRVTFPQPGVGFKLNPDGTLAGPITVVTVGKLATLHIDILLVVPPGIDNNVAPLEIKLPPEFAAEPSVAYSSSLYYDNDLATIPSSVAALYVEHDLVKIFTWNAYLRDNGSIIYISGEIQYVTV